MYVFATWVIWPAFSASVIFERQSVVDVHPAAATDACDAPVGSATESAAATTSNPSSELRLLGFDTWSLTIDFPLTAIWAAGV
jgi:hypothetical protein